MDTRTLRSWFRRNGRHTMPWRQISAPWPVLVSEVMLQQTSVSRVDGRWQRFMARWPSPETCAAAPLDDILREWQGLGYPRRARGLWQTAQQVAGRDWPRDEAGLRALPGIGEYTARALLWITADDPDCPPPRDVNLARIAARAGRGCEPWEVPAGPLDEILVAARPRAMTRRDYVYALFDVGAKHCRASPRCDGCPFARGCTARTRSSAPSPPATRQPRYHGSMRETRGLVLRAVLGGARSVEDLVAVTGRDPDVVLAAATALADEGLIPAIDGNRADAGTTAVPPP